MSKDNSTLVQIFDHSLRISSEAGGEAHVKEAADYLDQKMRSAASAVGKRSPLDIAILAAMEIAEEILAVRGDKDELLCQADERIRFFTRRLEDDTSNEDGDSEIPPPTPRF